ncbi:MAG: hypothetical protein C6I05_00225 [Epsilonproteobacteria bacterium]|nr:hypothetical protein [Campylobacterota bacterium]
MVNFLRNAFAVHFDLLQEVSDGMCQNTGRGYIDFDGIFPNFRTVDSLILPPSNDYLLFVEFKDVRQVDNLRQWLQKKERVHSIWLKGYESSIALCHFIVKNSSLKKDSFWYITLTVQNGKSKIIFEER